MNNKISRIQFDILTLLEKEKKNISQREIAKLINKSVGTVNKAVASIT